MIERTFPPLLRSWRLARSMSQARLAECAEVSARHISFLENGRSQPSREMVLVLANALDIPLRERNAMLTAAGYAAVYRESPLESQPMVPIRRALDHILRSQEPYGALVVDRLYNVIEMNRGARCLFGTLIDIGRVPPVAANNILHAVFHPDGLRPHMLNWELVARSLVTRLQREALTARDDDERALIEALLSYPGVPTSWALPDLASPLDVVLPVHLRHGETEVRLFTMMTTLGTPLDVTAEELRIESYFPADDETDRWIRALSAGPASA